MSALKSLAQLGAAILAAVIPVLALGPLDSTGFFNVVALAAGAVGVYITSNHLAGVWRYAKTVASAVAAVCVVLVSVWSGGITTLEWVQILAAAAGTLGVFAAPNKRDYALAG